MSKQANELHVLGKAARLTAKLLASLEKELRRAKQQNKTDRIKDIEKEISKLKPTKKTETKETK
jgi:hypothetical protein